MFAHKTFQNSKHLGFESFRLGGAPSLFPLFTHCSTDTLMFMGLNLPFEFLPLPHISSYLCPYSTLLTVLSLRRAARSPSFLPSWFGTGIIPPVLVPGYPNLSAEMASSAPPSFPTRP